jgi:hypothetical protein
VFTAPNQTQLLPVHWNSVTTLNSSTTILANLVSNAQAYRWHIVRSDGAETYYDTSLRSIILANVPFGFIWYNTTYTIRVSVKVAGVWYPYWYPRTVTTNIPVCNLSTCSGLTISNKNTNIYANIVSYVPGYVWEIQNMNTLATRNFQTTARLFNLNNPSLTAAPFGFVTANTQYCVKVRPLNVNGVDNLFYSSTCCFTTGTVLSKIANAKEKIYDFEIIVSPNPYKENFEIKLTSNSDETVEVFVYDVLGKRIDTMLINKNELEHHSFGKNYSSGVYTIIVTQAEETKTIKVIKQ